MRSELMEMSQVQEQQESFISNYDKAEEDRENLARRVTEQVCNWAFRHHRHASVVTSCAQLFQLLEINIAGF
jgi:hypothetical protein